MRQVKRVERLSVMKIKAICYGLLGLLEGLLFSFAFPLRGLAGSELGGLSFLFRGLSIVFFPILFAVMGAVFSWLGAVVYNDSARYVGGIQVEVE